MRTKWNLRNPPGQTSDAVPTSPQWRGLLEVNEVELDHEHTSLN